MSVRLRRSVLAAGVFILAGVGGTVGGHATGKLTPATVTFAILLAVGGLAALMLDRLSGKDETERPPRARVRPSVDARWAQAVQIGDHNVLVNDARPLEARGQVES